MDKKIAIISIIVEDVSQVGLVNELLSQYGDRIIGRMGMPYREKNLSIISVVMDTTPDEINTLSGKLGKISGISVKTLQTKK